MKAAKTFAVGCLAFSQLWCIQLLANSEFDVDRIALGPWLVSYLFLMLPILLLVNLEPVNRSSRICTALGAVLLLYSAYSFCFVHLGNVTRYRELAGEFLVLLIATSIIFATAYGLLRSIAHNDAKSSVRTA